MVEAEQAAKCPSEDYIEHTYYRLGGDLLFKCIVRKDIGNADFQVMMDGVERARNVFNSD